MIKKVALIDCDTIAYTAACVIQKTPLVVTHKISGRKKEFKNRTEWKEFLASDKGKGYHEDDFDVASDPRLVEPLENALHTIKLQIEAIASLEWCSDFHIYLGGEGNFRKDIATMAVYKGNRPPKPLAYQDCYNYIVNKWGDKVTLSHGEEAEDGVAIAAWPKYLEARKLKDREASDVVICHCDKDLNQVPGWHFNYQKKENGLYWINDQEAAKHFWAQMLKGDPTDCIVGLKDVTDRLRSKWSLRKSTGCGEAAANGILATAKTERECAERVVEAYKDYHGDNWQAPFKENGLLLRMRSFPGEMWNAVEHCKKLGIEV